MDNQKKDKYDLSDLEDRRKFWQLEFDPLTDPEGRAALHKVDFAATKGVFSI